MCVYVQEIIKTCEITARKAAFATSDAALCLSITSVLLRSEISSSSSRPFTSSSSDIAIELMNVLQKGTHYEQTKQQQKKKQVSFQFLYKKKDMAVMKISLLILLKLIISFFFFLCIPLYFIANSVQMLTKQS